MNALKWLGLCALVWLTGCAATAEHKPDPVMTDSAPVVLAPSTTLNSAAKTPATSAPNARAAAANAKPAAPGDTKLQANLDADLRASSRAVASLSPPRDLWERIRNGYAMPDLDNDLVHDREQWYANRPDYIFRMTERSKKYLFYIVEELELRNMPTELALLPFVESAFNPQAVSGAKAAGMWQFMPATGRDFELKQNVFRDDRRDVLASTRAALDYLQKLYNMFGDWHLALAAYNWGEGSVGRAIGKNQRAGLKAGYTDLSMPMETRLYVPKLQAIKNIVAQPGGFNSRLPDIGNHPYFDTVTIRRDIDVVLAAKLAEVPMEDFKALNPSVNKPVIMAAGTPQILLPWDNAKVFQANLDAYSGGRLASWTVWVAPSTMRAADAAKRVGMGEAEFRSINNIPPRMMIRPGSALLVPRSAHSGQDVTSHVADTGQMTLSPEIVLRKTSVRVGKGATVANVALKYKVSAASVAQWNGVAVSAAFKNKQTVILYLPPGKASKAAPARAAAAPAAKKAVKKRG
ncbi:lytic transglycosylase [Rhodoferax lacus]|uniref:Lytic transglycosylase n=1 Tax=Rhodoferax lacus TaxID=2184758 RepID=A0A3E1RC95_9BURK|nr:transglycosylase SLT domain-containing protein [Rhodoferax lacus]RFO96986.1 lytic transglycosylase [Rhodoferax lacus]